jgi:hypothetical protein
MHIGFVSKLVAADWFGAARLLVRFPSSVEPRPGA